MNNGNLPSKLNVKPPVLAYRLHDALYLNITNRCPNACQFCIRGTENGVGYNLWLDREPTAEEVIEAIGDPTGFQEVVFCGYGEPLVRPEVVIAVSRWLKENRARKVRVNTNGLADLFLGYDILPELRGLIDEISISLNSTDAEGYLKLTRSKFGLEAFEAVLDFAKRGILFIPKVTLSVVNFPGVDLEKAAQLTRTIGAEFKIRQFQG